nr:protein FAM47E [Meriones unguiculatus]
MAVPGAPKCLEVDKSKTTSAERNTGWTSTATPEVVREHGNPRPRGGHAASNAVAERGHWLLPTTLAPRLLRERGNCRCSLKNLPSKCSTKRNRMKFPGSLDSRRWVFVREGLDDFQKGCPPRQSPKDAFLPHIHHRAPSATPRKRKTGLPREAPLLSRLSKPGKAFLEDVDAKTALHPLALYPTLKEALPAELLLQVLEVLDPERKLKDTQAYCPGSGQLMKEATKLVEKCSPQVCLPKKMMGSHPGQWLCEEKPSKVDLLCEDRLVHEDIRRGVSDFCAWATALGSSTIDEEFLLEQFDIGRQTRHSCDTLHLRRLSQVCGELERSEDMSLAKLQEAELHHKAEHGRRLQKTQDPSEPKRVKMRYGAWYLNTNLWKKQRADEPLVDPKISYKAQDTNLKKQLQDQEKLLAGLHGTAAFKDFVLSRGYRLPRFLEKIYTEEKVKSENMKAPKRLAQTERNPGRR